MKSFIEPQPLGVSFDDEVRTSARRQACISREFGYRTEAAHIDRYIEAITVPDEESAA